VKGPGVPSIEPAGRRGTTTTPNAIGMMASTIAWSGYAACRSDDRWKGAIARRIA
jgi:hypothetical protein